MMQPQGLRRRERGTGLIRSSSARVQVLIGIGARQGVGVSQTGMSGVIPGQRAGLSELPSRKTPMPPHLTKAVIQNFRLLRETELSFTDDVTLCVGRNNTGKTSLAKLFKLFLAKKDSVLRIEDFSAECYAEFLDAHRLYVAGEKEQARGRIPKVTLTLHIGYDANCVSATRESWFWITFSARATEGYRNRDHERPRALRRTRLRSRSKLARPNICRFSILILMLWPSTAPEL
ncbi:ATP-binding protein [Streptomyces spongiae]|uniref:ATP-binding protein n=1 Tax=Streptomyces spongiae TaxID=565072 RepID=A0A5N8XBS9_9ACTN|nr:ATP-binding protein [Streptomyces spongiae]